MAHHVLISISRQLAQSFPQRQSQIPRMPVRAPTPRAPRSPPLPISPSEHRRLKRSAISTRQPSQRVAKIMENPGYVNITRAISLHSCWIRTATTSKPSQIGLTARTRKEPGGETRESSWQSAPATPCRRGSATVQRWRRYRPALPASRTRAGIPSSPSGE